MKSMTGYGSSTVVDSAYEVEIQISSVNRRHNEIVVRLPKEYGVIETAIRRYLSSKIGRGQVTVTAFINKMDEDIVSSIDLSKVEKEIDLLKTMAERCQCSPPVELALLDMWKNRFSLGSKDEDLKVVDGLVEKALAAAFEVFDANRSFEGAHIRKELMDRLLILRRTRETIIGLVSGHVEEIRQHLKELLDALVPSLSNDERVFREVVLYADRSDVCEELSRIDHHLNHMEELLKNDSVTGKLLEFIMQELLREWNTLGAKTTSSEASTCVVLAKMELEKMREQVQNVE